MERLFAYLKGFHERTQPLTFLGPILAVAEAEFEEKWEAGEVEGWEEKGAGVTGFVDATIDLDSFASAEALLEGVDMDTIKPVLQSLGMKTGGTPLQRAQRLFSTKVRAFGCVLTRSPEGENIHIHLLRVKRLLAT